MTSIPCTKATCWSLHIPNMPIVKAHARQIFDSRGNPTVEVDLYTDKGCGLPSASICFSDPSKWV